MPSLAFLFAAVAPVPLPLPLLLLRQLSPPFRRFSCAAARPLSAVFPCAAAWPPSRHFPCAAARPLFGRFPCACSYVFSALCFGTISARFCRGFRPARRVGRSPSDAPEKGRFVRLVRSVFREASVAYVLHLRRCPCAAARPPIRCSSCAAAPAPIIATFPPFFLRLLLVRLSAVSPCAYPPPIFLPAFALAEAAARIFPSRAFLLPRAHSFSLARASPSHARTPSSLVRTFPLLLFGRISAILSVAALRVLCCRCPTYLSSAAVLLFAAPIVGARQGLSADFLSALFCLLPRPFLRGRPADFSPSSLFPCSSPHILQRAARRVRAEIRHKIPVNPHGKHGAPSPKNTARNPTSDYINIYRLHTTLYGDYLHRLPLGLAPPHRDRDTCVRKRAFRGGVSLFKMSHLHFRLLFGGCRCGAERQFSPREVSRGGGFLQRRLGGFISCGCELSFSMKRRLPTEPRFCTPIGEWRGR